MKLTFPARREFRRLVAAATARGLIGRIDPGHVTLCAHLTAELERILRDPVGPETIKMVTTLTSQIRGMRREMALTLQPSRNQVKTVPGAADGGSYGAWKSRTGGV